MKRITGQAIWRNRAAIALTAFLIPVAVSAGTVTVDEAASAIAVDSFDADVDEILGQIGQSQGFQIERVGPAPVEKVSASISGPLVDVVARILQNENHVILYSATAKAGISRVVLFGVGAKSDNQPGSAVMAAAALSKRTTAGSPQPLPREVIAPTAPAAPVQPMAKRPRG